MLTGDPGTGSRTAAGGELPPICPHPWLRVCGAEGAVGMGLSSAGLWGDSSSALALPRMLQSFRE